MYALNLDTNNRILSATFEQYATEVMPIVEELPNGDITEYKYINSEYVYEPKPVPPKPTTEPSQFDRIEAQYLEIVG